MSLLAGVCAEGLKKTLVPLMIRPKRFLFPGQSLGSELLLHYTCVDYVPLCD